MRKWQHKIIAAITRSFIYDTNNDLRNTILVAGSARSGTTWLAEIINQNKDYRLIFEPFLGEKVPMWRPYHLRHFQSSENPDTALNIDLSYILSGAIRNRWADSLNLKIKCDMRIVKAVRINLLLPYIAQEFPEIRIVFIHRNPFDVIRSRLALGWEDHLDSVLDQESFLQKYFPANIEYLKSLVDPIEKQAAFWAVENYPILKHPFTSKNSFVVNYELLKNQDSDELGKLSDFIDTRLAYKKYIPSQSAATNKKRALSEEEKNCIQEVLNRLR